MRLITVLCVVGLAPAILPGADAPYIGKWKLNPGKSQLTGETTSFEKLPSGMIRRTSEGVSSEFRPDGKEYPTPDGGTVSVKEVAPDKWDITVRMNGKVIVTGTSAVKGDTLTTTDTLHKPDGGTAQGSSTSTRVSGGPGFFGTWKSTQTKTPVSLVEISANGADGVTLKYPEFGLTISAKFDAKDYPATGQFAGSKDTFTFKATGPRSFEVTQKTEGKPTYLDAFSVSGDGKTLTDDGTPISAREPTKAVYERQ